VLAPQARGQRYDSNSDSTRLRQDLKGRKTLRTKILSVAAVCFIFPMAVALAQQTPSASPVPAATETQANCTGFITTNVPTDVTVIDGANNDLEEAYRQFGVNELIYLQRHNGNFSVGEEYFIVRPAKLPFRTTRYEGEQWAIHKLGEPYEDVGRAKVTVVTPKGAVAEVSFACGPISRGDIALPYQPRPIPEYTPTELDRFPLPNDKIHGSITAAQNNFASVALGDIVYLDIGAKQGAQVGQRYRVYYVPAAAALGRRTWLGYPDMPRETVGEIVVLSTQEKSAAAIIVSCTRDISLGYGVELE